MYRLFIPSMLYTAHFIVQVFFDPSPLCVPQVCHNNKTKLLLTALGVWLCDCHMYTLPVYAYTCILCVLYDVNLCSVSVMLFEWLWIGIICNCWALAMLRHEDIHQHHCITHWQDKNGSTCICHVKYCFSHEFFVQYSMVKSTSIDFQDLMLNSKVIACGYICMWCLCQLRTI